MKKLSLAMVLLLSLGWCASVSAALLEAAESCDAAQKQLSELVKKPDSREASQIRDALGVDILVSCSTEKGNVICFQCLDKDGRSVRFRSFRIWRPKNSNCSDLAVAARRSNSAARIGAPGAVVQSKANCWLNTRRIEHDEQPGAPRIQELRAESSGGSIVVFGHLAGLRDPGVQWPRFHPVSD